MLTSFLLTILSVTVSAHVGCGTDNHKYHVVKNMNIKPKTTTKNPILEGRAQEPLNTAVAYENIRITLDTTQLESDWSGYDKLSYFKDDVIPAAYEWLQNVISVMPVNGDLTFQVGCRTTQNSKCIEVFSTWQDCGDTGATVPTFMFDELEMCPANACSTTQFPQGTGVTNTDLMIYFTGDASKDDTDACEGVMGFAGSCHSNSRNRPIGGFVNLCRSTIDSATVLTWEESIALIIHETFHILGFMSDAFHDETDNASKFINPDGTPRTDVFTTITKRGETRAVITLPTVVEKAKEYFGCDTIDGIELENYPYTDGRLTSHWDNRIIIQDFMVSYVPNAATYGLFTLAVLADSGWYEIDWTYAQEAPHGRHSGCKWYNNKCITNDVSLDNNVFCTDSICDGEIRCIDHSCGVTYTGAHACELTTWTQIPTQEQYFSDPIKGGDLQYPDFCPLIETVNSGDCRLYGDNNVGAPVDNAHDFAGFVSGNSKCVKISGSLNPLGTACYPLECFINYKGEYVGTRMTHWRNYLYSAFDVVTCWSDEDSTASKDLNYVYHTDKLYGFDQILCPDFENICYDRNPWMCSGHGTKVDGNCVCSPGYFGIDCTIENNAANRAQYTNTDSVNIYQDTVCNGGGDWEYEDDDNNTGILNIEISGVGLISDYTEMYFQTAIKNWIAILTSISQCDVDLRSYSYVNNVVSVDVYYYSSRVTWNDVKDSESMGVFNKLFDSTSNTQSVTQQKESAGQHKDNIDMGMEKTVDAYIYAMILVFVAYLV